MTHTDNVFLIWQVNSEQWAMVEEDCLNLYSCCGELAQKIPLSHCDVISQIAFKIDHIVTSKHVVDGGITFVKLCLRFYVLYLLTKMLLFVWIDNQRSSVSKRQVNDCWMQLIKCAYKAILCGGTWVSFIVLPHHVCQHVGSFSTFCDNQEVEPDKKDQSLRDSLYGDGTLHRSFIQMNDDEREQSREQSVDNVLFDHCLCHDDIVDNSFVTTHVCYYHVKAESYQSVSSDNYVVVQRAINDSEVVLNDSEVVLNDSEVVLNDSEVVLTVANCNEENLLESLDLDEDEGFLVIDETDTNAVLKEEERACEERERSMNDLLLSSCCLGSEVSIRVAEKIVEESAHGFLKNLLLPVGVNYDFVVRKIKKVAEKNDKALFFIPCLLRCAFSWFRRIVHSVELHNVLIVVDFLQQSIEWYDPKGNSFKENTIAHLYEDVKHEKEMCADRFLQKMRQDLHFCKVVDLRQQHQPTFNSTDCGRYVLAFMLERVRGYDLKTIHKNMQDYRYNPNQMRRNLASVADFKYRTDFETDAEFL